MCSSILRYNGVWAQVCQSDGVQLVGYTDFRLGWECLDRKSTSGCCFSLGSAVISWFSRKQSSVALSSTEVSTWLRVWRVVTSTLAWCLSM
jgi:hypothetical protein